MSSQRYVEKQPNRPPAADEARDGLLARTRVTKPTRGHRMSSTTRARFQAAIVAIAPAWLLAALVYRPYIPDLSDKAAVAGALLASGPTRWGLSRLAVGVGSGLAVLAFLAIRSYLREAGDERWSVVAFPFIILGSTLFAFLPAMEIATLAAAETGADVQAVQTALDPWFFPILLAGSITFGFGALGFTTAIVRSGVLGPGPTWLVVGALVVMAAARFVPMGAALYVGGAAAIVALWPLAYGMLKNLESARLAGQPRSMPAI